MTLFSEVSGMRIKPDHWMTCIVFDWDDTLLASTHILEEREESEVELAKVDKLVTELVTKALVLSTVYIVTNATLEWVAKSAKLYLPSVVPLLERVTILSARSLYQLTYPDQPLVWKCETFKCIPGGRDIVSFGDSEFERVAVLQLCATLPSTFCKSVKFQVCPTVEELTLQLEYILANIEEIIKYEGHLDVYLSPPVAK